MKINYHHVFKKHIDFIEKFEVIDVNFRLESLLRLKQCIYKNEDKIISALREDLGKPEFESYTSEIGFIYTNIDYIIKRIYKWTKVKRVKDDLAQMLAKSYVYPCPYGHVLIIAPYNYPFQLVMEPLIGAIAAGNTVVVKPSEYAPNTENIIKRILEESFDIGHVSVLTGDYTVINELMDLPFDYIFFTGSVGVGKLVMEKASRNLIPLTLELGGKSPAIVDDTAKLNFSAVRIAWGKFINAGQTCVAPDYVLVHESVHGMFINSLKKAITKFYGDDIIKSKDFGRIINERHVNRLNNIIEKDRDKIIFGGHVSMEERYVSPTIIDDANYNDGCMKDEIFGPILPIIKYKTFDDIKKYINIYKNPLALYVFSQEKNFQNKIISNFSFGGGCINDTITHVASNYLPFGGVGRSGMGKYHGYNSFLTFTHQKSIVKKTLMFNIKLLFPPYKDKINFIKMLVKSK